ncbi:hypothetical protein [Pelagovum pacificum]|uniref:Glycerophosphoryl diester phosphodiesterase membrane domain-containing protein n=1 Tax=Pelagovum pacificum TaxID=2588711 RepID=A0A5C5GIP0_9RHOB|nr:hypothetical protein [Pelagovum pacificum]QQA42834.1 hypothetical protein I8N54_19020 [Pelagovum pacificum]TNY34017.1 hypothetical protein FHY64_12365 [Pelagovum pacificum]
MSVHIVRHAIMMVLRNIVDALKVSAVPVALGLILAVVLITVLGLDLETVQMMSDPVAMSDPEAIAVEDAGPMLILLLVLIPTVLFVFGWVAVAWHRFVLLEEYPGAVPTTPFPAVRTYVGRSLLIGVLILLVMVPSMFVLSLVLTPLMMVNQLLGISVFTILLSLVTSYVSLRWALVLPAAAIGDSMKLSESWSRTAKLSNQILGVALLLALLNFVLGLLAVPFGALGGQVIGIAITWFVGMVGLSVLTTLYGHLVENRPLAE